MKKVISVLLLIILIMMGFTACSSDENKIEDFEWELGKAMNIEKEGLMVALGEEDTAYPDAEIVDVLLTANDGSIVIEDKTNGKTYEGAYEEMYVTDSNDDYKIIIKGKEGYVNVSRTIYQDGREVPTLILTIDGYDMYFYGKTDK